jgi:hypothetical protein
MLICVDASGKVWCRFTEKWVGDIAVVTDWNLTSPDVSTAYGCHRRGAPWEDKYEQNLHSSEARMHSSEARMHCGKMYLFHVFFRAHSAVPFELVTIEPQAECRIRTPIRCIAVGYAIIEPSRLL